MKRTDKTSSYLSLLKFKKGEYRYVFRCLLLGISLVVVLFFFDILLPKLKLKYRLYKELKEKKKREEAFAKKMKELEIK